MGGSGSAFETDVVAGVVIGLVADDGRFAVSVDAFLVTVVGAAPNCVGLDEVTMEELACTVNGDSSLRNVVAGSSPNDDELTSLLLLVVSEGRVRAKIEAATATSAITLTTKIKFRRLLFPSDSSSIGRSSL